MWDPRWMVEFIGKALKRMDDLGVPPLETSILLYIYISFYIYMDSESDLRSHPRFQPKGCWKGTQSIDLFHAPH
jgi:hypothetical protein